MFRTNQFSPGAYHAVAALLLVSLSGAGHAQQAPWSQRMDNTTIKRWPEGHFAPAGAPWHWNYELGTLLEGMDAVWYGSAKGEYFRYVKKSVDQFVGTDGSISTYDATENSLDNILLGRQLLLLYGVTQDKRYYKAATRCGSSSLISRRMRRADSGTRKIYPNQMWLDGLYMAEPFYAEYAAERWSLRARNPSPSPAPSR